MPHHSQLGLPSAGPMVIVIVVASAECCTRVLVARDCTSVFPLHMTQRVVPLTLSLGARSLYVCAPCWIPTGQHCWAISSTAFCCLHADMTLVARRMR